MALTVRANADVVTINGLSAFDESLGVLTKVTVSIDILERDMYIGMASTQLIAEHQHIVTIPAIQIGDRILEFPPVLTSVAPAGLGHTHQFDPPPVSEIYSGSDLRYFQPSGLYLYPFGFFLRLDATSEAEGHRHILGPLRELFVNGSTEIQTTFEYTPVPEPPATLTLGIAVSVVQCFWRSRYS